ncbi:putative ATPase (AAA+ superfamily) [Candidatus Nanobsidianus stetteri]|uniref:Putative ATPase (AAA+ superfamily) n=1 Tax=Nanobsidianus stetteri TaxID=1294122 RepID=R1E4R9_NANST|nr:putative ATPase (AAA+ superfamily) [Candidatus Nanobsidianus stetteri]
MENLVAIELKRREKEFYYWKEYGKSEGQEVDFLIKENNIIKELIQVSYINNIDEIDRREIRSLIKASSLLNCNDLKIITWDLEDKIIKDNKEIKLIPLWKWLLNR